MESKRKASNRRRQQKKKKKKTEKRAENQLRAKLKSVLKQFDIQNEVYETEKKKKKK